MIQDLTLWHWGLVFSGFLIGFGAGVWFALKFRNKK